VYANKRLDNIKIVLTNISKERYLETVQIPVNLTRTYLDPFVRLQNKILNYALRFVDFSPTKKKKTTE
jgi:hypothetical protein